MEILLDNLREISPLSGEIKLRVTVVRLWEVPSRDGPRGIVSSLEMVVADEQGCKIQASVPEVLLHLFVGKFCRGRVYIISNFAVVPNLGSYRVTNHDYRLIFQASTSVSVTGRTLNPMNSLSLVDSSIIWKHQNDCDFLADTIGLLIGISEPKKCIIEARVEKLIFLEFLDCIGKFKCVLSGDSAAKFKVALTTVAGGRPVVVVRFAKIKIILGGACVINVKDISQIFMNPNITQLHEFRERLALRGILPDGPVELFVPRFRMYGAAEFLLFYPKLTINELNSVIEDGMFVVSAILTGFLEGEEWWFPCTSLESVEKDVSSLIAEQDGPDCEFRLTPRFRVKFKVCDGTDEAVFQLFDNDLTRLVRQNCVDLVNEVQGKNSEVFPLQFRSLFGNNFLFLVEKESTSNPTLDCPYRVRRVCANSIVVDLFNGMNRELDREFFPLAGCGCQTRGR